MDHRNWWVSFIITARNLHWVGGFSSQRCGWLPQAKAISNNVGITIKHHPPVITMDGWYGCHSQSWVVYSIFIPTSLLWTIICHIGYYINHYITIKPLWKTHFIKPLFWTITIGFFTSQEVMGGFDSHIEVKIKDDRRSAERKQIVEKAEGARWARGFHGHSMGNPWGFHGDWLNESRGNGWKQWEFASRLMLN